MRKLLLKTYYFITLENKNLQELELYALRNTVWLSIIALLMIIFLEIPIETMAFLGILLAMFLSVHIDAMYTDALQDLEHRITELEKQKAQQ